MRLLEALRELASEQDCALCGLDARAPLCHRCLAIFPRLPEGRCPCCALPSLSGIRCGRCLTSPPSYDATVAAFAYGPPLDHALQSFKYRNALGLTRSLSDLLDRAIVEHRPVDLVVPVPLAPSRLAERGYNQALELARPIAARRRLQLDAKLVLRLRDTPQQASLPWRVRAQNIRHAFGCARNLAGRHLAVVDDVMTTGATLNEVARILKEAGAASVTNWVIARTLPHPRPST